MLDLTTDKNRRVTVTSHNQDRLVGVMDTGTGNAIYTLLNPEQALEFAQALTKRKD